MVERQFPDNQSHLAWVYGEGRITDQIGMSAAAEVVYIDAATGDPLLLIKDIHAGDPSFTCSQLHNTDKVQQVVLYLTALLISAAYLVAAILVKPKFAAIHLHLPVKKRLL